MNDILLFVIAVAVFTCVFGMGLPIYINLIIKEITANIAKDINTLDGNIKEIHKFVVNHETNLQTIRKLLNCHAYYIERGHLDYLDHLYKYYHASKDLNGQMNFCKPERTPEAEIAMMKRMNELDQQALHDGFLPLENPGDNAGSEKRST